VSIASWAEQTPRKCLETDRFGHAARYRLRALSARVLLAVDLRESPVDGPSASGRWSHRPSRRRWSPS
jgi:hypothetical protein